jgi:hypothetical protein
LSIKVSTFLLLTGTGRETGFGVVAGGTNAKLSIGIASREAKRTARRKRAGFILYTI